MGDALRVSEVPVNKYIVDRTHERAVRITGRAMERFLVRRVHRVEASHTHLDLTPYGKIELFDDEEQAHDAGSLWLSGAEAA